MKKQYGTSVITDIRNFTGIFEHFQLEESDDFLKFLEEYYKIQSQCANIICNNEEDLHISSTGDGVLTIFFSENSPREGYAFLLSIHRYLTMMTKSFTEKSGIETSFGIGADSGHVWDVGKNMEIKLDTYVGNVINRSSRVESLTKEFGDTRAAIGNFLYRDLMRDLYPKAFEVMEDYKDKYDSLLNEYPDVVLLSKELMLVYLYEMVLKNIEKPLPIFRLSEYMTRDDNLFWSVMDKLLSSDKIRKLKRIL